ncbi:Protein of unknown function [Pyronema omphalodes CBS 100304]|uniref:Uncharacterized protein n=1 Tax=Pyronema omphalodes (strain CBS 100304) TaxID=1076935 RepID=U4L581_PYROM|nr:Protein of unknown function [Pyronema omphalodes CBS 100304]
MRISSREIDSTAVAEPANHCQIITRPVQYTGNRVSGAAGEGQSSATHQRT